MFWLGAGLLEVPLITLLAGRPLPLAVPVGAACHALAAAVMFFAPPKERGWFSPMRHWGEPMFFLTLLVPGFGWLASGLLGLAHAAAVDDKDAYRFEESSAEDANPLASLGTPEAIRKELADALDVLPAADALLSHDPALKRGAIETLARIRTVDSVAWILQARTDPDPEVRFFATSALTRLKREYETSVQAAEHEALAHPGDPVPQLSLQRVRYEYAVSGILDGAARRAVLSSCRDRLAAAAERGSEAAQLAFLVEKALDPAGAFPALDRLESSDPARSRRWVREQVQLLFDLGRHREAQALLQARRADLLGEPGADPEWGAAVLWWTHG